MSGILVSQTLRSCLASGVVSSAVSVVHGQIQPSSLDLRLGGRAWQLQCSFLPGPQGISRKLARLATSELRVGRDEPLVLHHGGVYLFELEEQLDLPSDVWGRANPKSSTGRLDVFVRLLTEHGMAFDTVPAGYRGPIYLEVTPQSFHVAVRRGDTLSQLRLGRGDTRLGVADLHRRQASAPLCSWSDGTPAPVDDHPPGLLLSVDLHAPLGLPVGWLAKRHQPPIDLSRRDLLPERWWTPLRADADDGCVLEPEQFYLFATRERLRVPPDLCAELVAFDATKGELRTHYAGFIDSGFGWTDDGRDLGSKLVLEIRTHDVPFLLEHGQALFRVEFMRNEAVPDVLYGTEGSHYQGQGLRLAKQFLRAATEA